MSDVVYLYGFVPSDTPPPPDDLRGVGGVAPRILSAGPVSAVVAHLPADRFDAASIEARMEDLGWVGEQGMAHERVVLWFVDHGDILPARLFSLYPGTAELRETVAGRADGIARALRALAGRREWNLKVACDARELGRHIGELSDEVRRMDADIEHAAPGRRYLLQRKRAELAERETARSAEHLARELLDALRPHALAVRTLPLTEADSGGAVVLNAALLLDRDAEPDARARAGELIEARRDVGLHVTFSGPWAPYRFLEDHVDS